MGRGRSLGCEALAGCRRPLCACKDTGAGSIGLDPESLGRLVRSSSVGTALRRLRAPRAWTPPCWVVLASLTLLVVTIYPESRTTSCPSWLSAWVRREAAGRNVTRLVMASDNHIGSLPSAQQRHDAHVRVAAMMCGSVLRQHEDQPLGRVQDGRLP